MPTEEFERKRQAAIDRIKNARRPGGRTARPAFDTTKMALDGIQRANPGGILAQPIPVSPKGEEYMKALDKVAPNVYAPTQEGLEQQRSGGGAATMAPTQEAPPQMAPAARQGPMTGIYRDRAPVAPGQQRYLQGLGLREKYNQAEAGGQGRADALNEIWDRGGVPVIGGGTQRAPVQDFGGVDGVMDSTARMRGIDTGMKVGSPEAEAHGAALARHQGSGIYGGVDRMAHLQRNAAVGRQGLLNTAAEKRALQTEATKAAIDQTRKGGGIGLTPELAMKLYEVDQRTSVEREKIAAEDRRAQESAASSLAPPKAVKVGNVWGYGTGKDWTPMPQPIQDARMRTENTVQTMQDSFGNPDMIRKWQNNANENNPKNRIQPAYNHLTGRYQWATERELLKPTMIGDTQIPVLQPLISYDPQGHNVLMRWLNSAVEEE